MRAGASYRGARRNAAYLGRETPDTPVTWRSGPYYAVIRNVSRWVWAPDPESKTVPPAFKRQFMRVRRDRVIHVSLQEQRT